MYNVIRVALILPKGHEYAARLIEGVVSFVHEHAGFEFVEVPYDENRTPPAAYHVEVDGALVWAHHDSPWVLDLRDRGVKLVSLNSEWRDDGIPCVGLDLEAMLDAAIEHLAGLGRKQAAYIGHLTARNPAKLRMRDGFLGRARRKGWTATAIEIPGIPSEERQRLAEPGLERELIDFLRGLGTPACIQCDDDYVGILVCRVAEHLGLTVPGDVAVLGLYDMAIARFSSPTLSSVPASGQLVGLAGMQLLSDLLGGARPTETYVMVAPPPVVERESTGGIAIRNDDIRKAHQMIEQHACEGLTVEQLLERFAISQKTLNKRFAAVYGHTPGAAIRRVRIEQAKRWLATTNLSIARIAAMCGFDEPSNFNLFFKRETGCTPSEYRRQSR
jgi:LacI family transcriptional regulator